MLVVSLLPNEIGMNRSVIYSTAKRQRQQMGQLPSAVCAAKSSRSLASGMSDPEIIHKSYNSKLRDINTYLYVSTDIKTISSEIILPYISPKQSLQMSRQETETCREKVEKSTPMQQRP